jgi:hypothetical protein
MELTPESVESTKAFGNKLREFRASLEDIEHFSEQEWADVLHTAVGLVVEAMGVEAYQEAELTGFPTSKEKFFALLDSAIKRVDMIGKMSEHTLTSMAAFGITKIEWV